MNLQVGVHHALGGIFSHSYAADLVEPIGSHVPNALAHFVRGIPVLEMSHSVVAERSIEQLVRFDYAIDVLFIKTQIDESTGHTEGIFFSAEANTTRGAGNLFAMEVKGIAATLIANHEPGHLGLANETVAKDPVD